jgi:hypothetical protein
MAVDKSVHVPFLLSIYFISADPNLQRWRGKPLHHYTVYVFKEKMTS